MMEGVCTIGVLRKVLSEGPVKAVSTMRTRKGKALYTEVGPPL
jgi:hypothetical protein